MFKLSIIRPVSIMLLGISSSIFGCAMDSCDFWNPCEAYNQLVCHRHGAYCRGGTLYACEGYCQCRNITEHFRR